MAEHKQKRSAELDAWVKSIYTDVSQENLMEWYEELRYQGFDRETVLKDLHEKLRDKVLAQKFILLCALRGPVGASKTSINGRNALTFGLPLKSSKGAKGASLNRITAALADYAAFLLKKLNVPKRIQCECPGWLQFPSAASISMPENYRKMHLEFAQLFSERINLDGRHGFNQDIYDQMVLNSYLDDSLDLFN